MRSFVVRFESLPPAAGPEPSAFCVLGNLLTSKTIPELLASPTNSAAGLAERRHNEMIAERHADRIFQVVPVNH